MSRMVKGFAILFHSLVSPLYFVFAVDMDGNKLLYETYLTYKMKVYILKDNKEKKEQTSVTQRVNSKVFSIWLDMVNKRT